MPTMPTTSDIKTYLGITGSQDDTLIAQALSDAIGKAEADTSRRFAAASNTVTRYSSDGQSSFTIHDRPYADAGRTVTWMGATLVEGTNVWFLPDRRDQNVSVTLQLRQYDTSRADWYKADPQWFDKNLDQRRYPNGMPNDVVITGVIGHPFPHTDVVGAIRILAAWLYWNAKSGASGVVQLPTGENIDLSETPPRYQDFVDKWRIRTAVAAP